MNFESRTVNIIEAISGLGQKKDTKEAIISNRQIKNRINLKLDMTSKSKITD